MQKTNSIRKGQIWLTVFRTDDGELVITFCKSYPTTQGWKYTNFLRPATGDIKNLMEALHEFCKLHESYSKGETSPSQFLAYRKTNRGVRK